MINESKVHTHDEYLRRARVLIEIKDEEAEKIRQSGYEAGRRVGYTEGAIDDLLEVIGNLDA